MYKREYTELLKSWCDAMLKLQIIEIKSEGIYGGIMCPSCSRIHGRSADAIYPFMYMAHTYNDQKFLDAAMRLFDWSSHVSRPDGSFINDTSAIWKGITVFGTIQLGEAIKYHGCILEPAVLAKWKARLRSAAEFLYGFIHMSVSNINYPITCSAALAIAGTVLDEPRYIARAREFARNSLEYFTPNNLIYGEGKPANRLSERGCRPVDLGYNVEETLGGLTMYGLLTKDNVVLDKVTESLNEHLEFMLPDGAWDNSWGTRSSKWTYWGSRTSDGCQIAYALMKDRNPIFAEAAYRNLQLYKECTHEGMLHGGPHYNNVGELPCIHHTFTHAKALATILDHDACGECTSDKLQLPREKSKGVIEYPEILTYLVSIGEWRGTITAYDWEYVKDGHATGGAITMLWNEKIGPLLVGTMTEYQCIEPNNMRIPIGLNHACLTPTVVYIENGIEYKSINDYDAQVKYFSKDDEIQFFIKGMLKDNNKSNPESGEIGFNMNYIFRTDCVEIKLDTDSEINRGNIIYDIPIISKHQEGIRYIDDNNISIDKENATVMIGSNCKLNILDSHTTKRIYNLCPGFEAVPVYVNLKASEKVEISISIK